MKLYHIYIETNKKDLLCINKQGKTPTQTWRSNVLSVEIHTYLKVIDDCIENREALIEQIKDTLRLYEEERGNLRNAKK